MVTLTANYDFNLPEVGSDVDVWGGYLNANWVQLDATFGYLTDSTSGATQAVDFSANKVHLVAADVATVTFSFTNPAAVAKVDLIIDYQNTGIYSLTGASYDSVSYSVSGQATFPTGLFFKPDGTKFYSADNGSSSVYQYTMSTSWDLTTASYDSVSFSIAAQDTSIRGTVFKPDGTKMYIVGTTDSRVYQYSLATAWDISTLAYLSASASITVVVSGVTAVFFKPDGTTMYALSTAGKIGEYALSVAWDVSSATDSDIIADVSAQSSYGTQNLSFSSDGTRMYVINNTSSTLFQYTLSTAWDLTTVVYDDAFLNATTQETATICFFFTPDSTKLYVLGVDNDTIYQYSTGVVGAELVFPAALEAPTIPLTVGKKTALTIVTADSGVSYQVTSVLDGIT